VEKPQDASSPQEETVFEPQGASALKLGAWWSSLEGDKKKPARLPHSRRCRGLTCSATKLTQETQTFAAHSLDGGGEEAMVQ